MGWKTAGRGASETAPAPEIKVTITIPVDGEGKLNTDKLEAAFTVNGELPPAFTGIMAGARAQLTEVISRVKAATTPGGASGVAGGGPVRRSRFTAELPDIRGSLAPRTPEKVGDRPPDRAAVRREFNERRFVEAVMDLPEGERRQLKAEFVRLLNSSGSLPGAGLLAEEQRRTGFSDPAVQSAFRNFLWGKLLKDGPEQEAAYAAYYNEKKWAWVDGKDLDQRKESPESGWQPSARGLAPGQEARLVERWLAAAE